MRPSACLSHSFFAVFGCVAFFFSLPGAFCVRFRERGGQAPRRREIVPAATAGPQQDDSRKRNCSNSDAESGIGRL